MSGYIRGLEANIISQELKDKGPEKLHYLLILGRLFVQDSDNCLIITMEQYA